jgi:acyl-CoA thioesterase
VTEAAHPLDEAIALQPAGEDRWLGRTHPAWGNMVGPYGGITAAQALSAVLRDPRLLGEPVALTVNFAAAVADGPFEIVARPVRTNRSTQHWTIELRQQDAAVLTGTAFTALRRDTWSADEHRLPTVPPPLEVPIAGGPRRVAWVRRYEMRFIEGAIPREWHGQDQGDSRSRLWMRDTPERPLDYAAITGLADVFFPRVWRRRPKLVPIGTVSMTVYYHADAAQLRRVGTGFVLGQAQAQAFRGGYYDQTAQLWSEAGDMLATTHQVVYYKE